MTRRSSSCATTTGPATANGETWPDRAERIVFRIFADPDTSYNALEAGEIDIANIPPARSAEAQSNWGTTVDISVARLVPLHHQPCAIRASVARRTCCCARRSRWRSTATRSTSRSTTAYARVSTGVTPPGIPGFAENLCDYCAYDPEAAQAAYDEWLAAGNEPETIPIQFPADAGHEPVVAIFVDNLAAIGIEAEADARIAETYFSELADGACVVCRAGWIADYPTYDNFMYDLFHTDSIGFNNYAGVSIPEFDALVDEAKQTIDPDAQAELFQQSEDLLLNQEVAVIPINWYLGDYAYNPETLEGFGHGSDFLIKWEQVTVNK